LNENRINETEHIISSEDFHFSGSTNFRYIRALSKAIISPMFCLNNDEDRMTFIKDIKVKAEDLINKAPPDD